MYSITIIPLGDEFRFEINTSNGFEAVYSQDMANKVLELRHVPFRIKIYKEVTYTIQGETYKLEI